ncbi:MAG: hypothetical protein M0C28_15340 [Candidatus Moduliflexus flocculans]|nr:hypothetical protein [Candidatus Moduliflexus flocculans]
MAERRPGPVRRGLLPAVTGTGSRPTPPSSGNSPAGPPRNRTAGRSSWARA